MTSVTTLETFTSPMMYDSSSSIAASISDKESNVTQGFHREMHDEGIVFNEEIAYSENEEDMSPLEGGGNTNEFYEEDEEYYVEALPETSSGPSGFSAGANSVSTVITANVTNGTSGEPVKKRRRRRTVPPEVKKDNHKERERARRNLIKDRFAYLRATIPTLGENAHKMARTEVLDHVIDYIQFMRNRNQNHMIEIENLRVSNVNIEEQTKGLAVALKYGYRLGGYMEPNNGEIVIDGVLPDSSVFVEGIQASAFDVDSQTSSVDSTIMEPSPLIEAPVAKLKTAPPRLFHGNHAVVQQHPIDEFYEQGGFENHNIPPQEERCLAHVTESSVVISGSVSEFCPSEIPETSLLEIPSAAAPVFHEQSSKEECNSENSVVKSEVEPEKPAARDGEISMNSVVEDNNQMYELQQSVDSVQIPTVVSDNVSAAGAAPSSGPPHHEASRSSLDLDVVFGYESPEEELIMLSELKDETALNGKKQQKQTKPRKPRTSRKQLKTDVPTAESLTLVGKPASRPRGRPKKPKAPQNVESSIKLEQLENPEPEDCSVNPTDTETKKVSKRRKSSRLPESVQD